jgi:drug/metabolite transporter (DMT)-like permease
MRNWFRSTFRGPGWGTACGIGAILLWSTIVALARSLSEQVGPITSAAAVHLIAGLASGLHLVGSSQGVTRIRQLPRRYLWGCGALFVTYMLVLFLGVGLAGNEQQVLEVGLLNYLWPTLTILFSLLLLNKRASLLVVPGTLAALLGVICVLTQGSQISWSAFVQNVAANPTAYTLGLTAAVSWALYSNLTRRWAGDGPGGGVDVFLPATGILLLIVALAAGEEGCWRARTCAETVFLGLVTWVAYRLWDVAMRTGNLILVAACSYLTPLFSTIVTCLYLGVEPGQRLWLGCVLIVSGSLMTWRSISE